MIFENVREFSNVKVFADNNLMSLKDFLKFESCKDDRESEEEYKERCDFFLINKEYDIFNNDNDLRRFCILNQQVIAELLVDCDVYELDTENVFKSSFKPTNSFVDQPLVKWEHERAVRFFEIPQIKEQYGNPDNLLEQFHEAEKFYDKDGNLELFNAVKSVFEK
ncbi:MULTISPECIES: hypothetical protein [unclassified Vibrio]|uniref:hypothetical protein n=1 Tax=unclassified Vibrio TaxID=2614977 RepID=UPI000C84270B|nr:MULTISPECIES: hypothetical protein [unclassified Vibrio]PMK77158.1 hypothetical protein BCT92_21400 [Vibrio sp. 10N.261.52.E5]TKF79560.1 hypothetical protein FCV65_21900 [Vibrio sp. F13]